VSMLTRVLPYNFRTSALRLASLAQGKTACL
jgi:hypothetical protein